MNKLFARKVLRTGSLVPDELEVYRRQTTAFRRKFGRNMRPDDPFFFDAEGDTPHFRSPDDAPYVLEKLAELMQQAGMEAADVYAFRKTGGLMPPGAASLAPQEVEEWEAAVAEYYAQSNKT